MRVPSPLRPLLSIGLLAAPAVLAAQDPAAARVPTFARVEGADGAPLAGAVVTFAGGHPHLGTDDAPTDLWQVQSDARGRVQARLQPGLCYVAWALGPGADDAPRALSPIDGWFGAGSLLTLRCGEPLAPRLLPVDGAAAWGELGPLRFLLMTPRPGLEIEVPLVDGALRVPVGPFDRLEVRTAAGAPLWNGPVTAARCALPPPQSLAITVADAAGRPVVGAVVRHRVARSSMWSTDGARTVLDDRWRELGRSDADGRCVVTVPYGADPLRSQRFGDLLLFVTVPGHPEVCGGVQRNELYENDQRVHRPDAQELRFVVPKAEPLVGNLGLLPRGTIAHLDVIAKLHQGGGNHLHDPRSYRAPVDADGTFRFDAVPVDLHSCRLTLVPPPASSFGLSSFAAHASRELPAASASPGEGLAADGLAELQVQVGEANGAPARGLVVFLVPRDGGALLVRDSLFRFPLDARGTASLRVPRRAWALLAIGDGAWAAQVLDVDGGTTKATLQLQPMDVCRFELHGDEDRPIAGARVVACGSTMQGQDDPLQAALQVVRQRWMQAWNRLRCDADGRVMVPFVPVTGVTQRVQLEWAGGATAPTPLRAGADWQVLRPR